MTAKKVSAIVRTGLAFGLVAASVLVAGCAMPVGPGDDAVSTTSDRLVADEAELGTGASSDNATPPNPGLNRMAETTPGHEPDPSPWAKSAVRGLIVNPAPVEEPDPSPWMHKLDSTRRDAPRR